MSTTTGTNQTDRQSKSTLARWTLGVFALSLFVYGTGLPAAVILGLTWYRQHPRKTALLVVVSLLPLVLGILTMVLPPTGTAVIH